MKRRTYRQQGPGALELIEEAVHLLRLAPVPVLATYYLGALPFVLGGLYFWADMARSATAYTRCAPAAFGVALLFLWMKTWQAAFAAQLQGQITGRPAAPLTFRRFLRVGLTQTIVQPSKLFLGPAALLVALPFGWVFAFYESVTALGTEEEGGVKQVVGRALRQARLWPRQNHLVLAILALFSLVVFLDVCLGLIQIPFLLKLFLGVESGITRGGWSFFNTTFLALSGGVAFLCLDPLIKAVYVLRTFYGSALETGEDLRVELRVRSAEGGVTRPPDRSVESRMQNAASPTRGSSRQPLRAILTVALLVFALRISVPARAGDPTDPGLTPRAPQSEISPVELDRAIEEVLSQRAYTWRLPRERPADDESKKGVFAAFMDGLLETLKSWGRTLRKSLKWAWEKFTDLLEWIQRKLGGRRAASPADGGGLGWIAALHLLVWVLVVLLACTAAIFLWRLWRQRRRPVEVVSEALPTKPDLGDESVLASELPEEEWLKLARELVQQGDLRRALRALYLASLAHLARRELIRIARFKSNRDYERELRRRGGANPELWGVFAENVTAFDRAWYGFHEVTGEALRSFESNVERIQAC